MQLSAWTVCGAASRRGRRCRSGMCDAVLDGGRGDGEASPRAEGCRPKELRTDDLHPPARASSSAIRGCRLVSQHAVAVSRGGLAPLACCSRSIPTSALCKSPKARPTCSREIQSAQVHPGHDRASVGQGGQGSAGGGCFAPVSGGRAGAAPYDHWGGGAHGGAHPSCTCIDLATLPHGRLRSFSTSIPGGEDQQGRRLWTFFRVWPSSPW